MKKLIVQDKKLRINIKTLEKKKLILKIVLNNKNFPDLLRLNAVNRCSIITNKVSQTRISNRCSYTASKKKFNKMTHFSRHYFIKLAKNKKIYGLNKSAW